MRKKHIIQPLLLAGVFALSGCGMAGESAEESIYSVSGGTEAAVSAPTLDISDVVSDRDMEQSYDEGSAATVTLSDNGSTSSSNAVQISGGTVTITDEGTYILSGELSDGMIIVNADDSDKVQLVLDGVSVTSPDSAAIYILEADKVFITTAKDTENRLINGGEYVAIDDNNIDAVIFSKADLTLNGEGLLEISAAAGHGVVSKDELVLTGGSYNITSVGQGLSGKDSISITDGVYVIASGKDGIHSENSDDAERGFIYISGGSFDISADGDGISASYYIQIEGGVFNITTGEGSASVTMSSGDSWGWGGDTSTAEDDTDVSRKGVKSDGAINIFGGSFSADTEDDSFHAGGDISISGGGFEIKSGDDAIHSDAAVVITDGDFNISYCYEGIEGLSITIDGGVFNIDSVDDGLNAAGGADSSGFGGIRPGGEGFSSTSSEYFIIINGGEFTVVSSGDCIDSNGSLTINGGTLNLTCNSAGNTALDCDGSYSNNGGSVTTNDGSENNPGQMGGGFGGMGGAHGGRGNAGNTQSGGSPGRGGMQSPM